MENRKAFIIAIDGPVASGKGTIAPQLADELNGFYIDTGVFYRCLALYCFEKGLDFEDWQAITKSLKEIEIRINKNGVFLNNTDVTNKIRNKDISSGASKVGSVDEVQKDMVLRQRELVSEKLRQNTHVIIEGRNVGTAIFPDADMKIFLTARPETRAQRRLIQLQERGVAMSLDEVLKDVQERDERDSQRKTYPLSSNPERDGYIILDNSDMTEEQTVNTIRDLLKRSLNI